MEDKITESAGNAALERQQTLWRPEHSPAAQAYLDAYLRERDGAPLDPDRLVDQPSGLDHRDIHSVINDRSVGERFFEVHCDLLHPTDSTYIDPVFGALHGQASIRAWLVPTMAAQDSGVGAVSFDPIFPAAFLDDGQGGTSVDEWVLMQQVGDDWIPVTRGVSVREYRDGWITYAVDHFDTTPIRIGVAMAAAAGGPAMELPDWPRVPTDRWERPASDGPSPNVQAWLVNRTDGTRAPGLTNRELHELLFEVDRTPEYATITADVAHPTDGVYIDPVFGEVRGQETIRAWLTDVMPKVGNVEFEQTRPPVFDGDVSYSEWRQVAVLPDGSRVVMTRGASIRRYQDGWLVHAADYFDTAPMMDPEIQAASAAAGGTLTLEDINRHRAVPIPDLS